MLCALLLLSACSKKRHFSVTGDIEGVGSQLVIATYYTAGGLKRVSSPAIDGKFSLRGEATRPTLLTLALSDGTRLATMVVENGNKMELQGDLTKPYEIEVGGNSESSDIASWVRDNAQALQNRDAAAINSSLAEWVGRHKGSKASTALMVSYFQTEGYEHLADSLMGILSQSARAQDIVQNFTGVLSAQLQTTASAQVPVMYLYDASDSVITFNPHLQKTSLLCFMPDDRTARDSVGRQIRNLYHTYPASRFRAVEISSASDSASWRRSLEGDSASWRRTWAPATVASMSLRKLAVPRIPFFIVADSSAAQIYRGSSIKSAVAAIESRLKPNK